MIKTILSSITSYIFLVMLFASSTLMAQTPNDIGVDSILTPIASCDGLQDSVRVRVQNYGTNQVDSFMLFWDINGVTGSMWVNSVLGTSPSSNTMDITVDTFLMNPGVFYIDTWTELPNNQTDTDILNDSASFSDSIEVFHVEFTFCTSGDTFYFINLSSGHYSCMWDFGDGTPLTTTCNPIHVYPFSSGVISGFTVTLVGYHFCGDEEFLIDTVGFGAWPYTGQNPCSWVNSVEEMNNQFEFDVYPNPNDGSFQISLNIDSPKQISVEVVDLTGVVVFAQDWGKVSGKINQKVNLKNVSPGVYFVKVSINNQISVNRILIE